MNNAAAASPGVRKTWWAWSIATFFGTGFWKPGPGTAGSVIATLLWLLAGHLVWAPPAPASIHLTVAGSSLALLTAAAAVLLLVAAIPASTIVARESGRKDPQIVVADEVVGQWITLIAAPAGWKYALLGLFFFRLFDILKPPPLPRIEDLPAGWGIMLDDVGAGLYALICLQAVQHLLGQFLY